MATIDETRKIRLKKLKRIETAGFLAYPGQTKRTHTCEEALKDFSKLSQAKKEIVLAGRFMILREHGGLVFVNIEDSSAKMQVLIRKNGVGEKSYKFFLDNFDIGDFIEVRGVLFKTKK